RNKQFNELNNTYGLIEYSLHDFVRPIQKHFKNNIDSFTAQKIATRCFGAFQKLMFHIADKVHFKKYGEMNSIEGKSNKTGIRFKDDKLVWNGLEINIIIKKIDTYAQKAIQDRVKYCRIVRKMIRGKYKYYVQLVMEGIPPVKTDKETGELKRNIGLGNLGIDIGTRTIAISSKNDVKLLPLCPEVENIQKNKNILQRKLDRQRRSNNLNNYNENRTIKCGLKLIWIKSNKYIKTQNKLRDIQRKQASIRKQSHEKLANFIISLGDRILVETMQFAGLQKRSKETTINTKTGKFNKRKRFGKSLANKAPSMLIEIINRKLKYYGMEILKINTQKVKASQYSHFTGEYNNKELKDRWNKDIQIQRDCYSAFLIMNVENDLKLINRELCNKTYDSFKTLHDVEINRLKEMKIRGINLISSMGI
ncbi:transposase, partial [Clostridium bowmanii]